MNKKIKEENSWLNKFQEFKKKLKSNNNNIKKILSNFKNQKLIKKFNNTNFKKYHDIERAINETKEQISVLTEPNRNIINFKEKSNFEKCCDKSERLDFTAKNINHIGGNRNNYNLYISLLNKTDYKNHRKNDFVPLEFFHDNTVNHITSTDFYK